MSGITNGRGVGRSVAVIFTGLMVAVPIALLSPLGDETNRPADSPDPEVLEGAGMRAELPAGWDGRIELIADGAPVFEGATFPLSGKPLIAHPYAGEHSIVAIVDWTTTCRPCPGFEPTSLPLSVSRQSFEARKGLPGSVRRSTSGCRADRTSPWGRMICGQGYDEWIRVGDTRVFAAGSQVTWIAGDLNLWVSPALGDERPSEDEVAALVNASVSSPFGEA